MAQSIDSWALDEGAARRKVRVIAAFYEGETFRIDVGTIDRMPEASEFVAEGILDDLLDGRSVGHAGEKIAIGLDEERKEVRLRLLGVEGAPTYAVPIAPFRVAVEEERPKLR